MTRGFPSRCSAMTIGGSPAHLLLSASTRTADTDVDGVMGTADAVLDELGWLPTS